MAHFTGIGAGIYTDLAVATPAAELTVFPTTQAGFAALFATEIQNQGGTRAAGAFVRIKNVREFPPIGTPANIVNVPVYGAPTSSQVQGQSDAPTLELTLNYVSNDWGKDATTITSYMVGDGIQRVFRFSLLNAQPADYGHAAAKMGAVPNSSYFFIGRMEALQVNPQLTDANTATLTLSMQGQFYGAYTV